MNTATTDVWLNSGPGQRLDGGTTSKSAGKDGRDSGGAGMMSTEDMQLAMAISASMGGGGGGGAEGGSEGEDEMARAIAMSLSQEESALSSPGERRVVGGVYVSCRFLFSCGSLVAGCLIKVEVFLFSEGGTATCIACGQTLG